MWSGPVSIRLDMRGRPHTVHAYASAELATKHARRTANTSEPGRGEQTACGAYVPRAGGDEAVDFLALRVHEAVAGCALHDVIHQVDIVVPRCNDVMVASTSP
jgi:hypothetical protein